MLEIEIDGTSLQVEEGSTVIEAAHKLGTYIPHFCYHKKLSIAANCRMCLVQVEKAPKPMPACATPVTNGMKVFTHSDLAVKAQKGVMEFLLINHPLDCPICDQGGECQLQDLAVGYGGSASKYQEEKRVVPNKDLGPLVATDMTRCINCTRCVRFTQEIAGLMELGQAFRGERAEVMPFVEQTDDSELSGNIIDLCPVGALTSKPFRFAARTWELSRRKSISPHDGLGTNLIVQTKHDRVLRVLPLENESVNECWLSDKDRYSYEALNSAERLTKPMVKQGGQWREVDWNVALDYVSHALRDVVKTHGGAAIGGLLSPHSTLEELFLAQQVLRGIGCENIDARLRQSDFSLDGKRSGSPFLGMKIAELAERDRVLVVGSFLRKEHPLIAQRLRQYAKRGTKVSFLNCANDDSLIKTTVRAIVAPSQLASTLAQVIKSVAQLKSVAASKELDSVTVGDDAKAIAQSLVSGRTPAILLGNFVQSHANAGQLQVLAAQLATLLDGKLGILAEAANSVGAYVAHATPGSGALNARSMIESPRKAYFVLNADAELDCADGATAKKCLGAAAHVVVLTPFKSEAALDYADVLLPVSPFTETSGTYVNCEGRVQSFYAAAKPLGETRPGWKVLRVLGNLLDIAQCDYSNSEEVRDAALAQSAVSDGFVGGLSNDLPGVGIDAAALVAQSGEGLERVADIPIHFADAISRRAPSLQQTKDSTVPAFRLNAATAARLGIADGAVLQVGAGGTATEAPVNLLAVIDNGVPDNCARVAGAHASTVALGGLNTRLTVVAGGKV